MFFIAWGQFSAMLTCISKDFYNLVGAATQALFWISAILYDVHTMIVPGWLKIFLMLNPISFIVSGFRNTFIYKVWIWDDHTTLWIRAIEKDVDFYSWILFVIMYLIMAILALWAYRKLYREIPDVI